MFYGDFQVSCVYHDKNTFLKMTVWTIDCLHLQDTWS